jgi:hypothetical protein
VEQVQPTDLSQEGIEGLKVGANINNEDFVEKYAKHMVREDRDVQGLVFYKLNASLEIGVHAEDQTLSRIIVSNGSPVQAKTAKGIAVGSTKKQVLEAYGDHFYQRKEQGLDVIGYMDPKQKTTLEFWMMDDQVQVIHFDASSK